MIPYTLAEYRQDSTYYYSIEGREIIQVAKDGWSAHWFEEYRTEEATRYRIGEILKMAPAPASVVEPIINRIKQLKAA